MFFEARRQAMGLPAYRKMVSKLIYEAGVDVTDIYNKRIERVADVRTKRALTVLTSPDIVRVLWGVLDTKGAGGLTKADIAASPLGEALLPYWGDLDADADGGVTKTELEAYLNKVEARNPSGYKAWIVDLLYDADLTTLALEQVQAAQMAESMDRKIKIAEV